MKGAEIGHGQSSLTGNSYPDRSVEDRSRHGDPSDSSQLNRDAALGTGAVATTAHHHEGAKRDNYAPDTDRSFPLGGSSISGGYGSSVADSHSPNLANKADPPVDNDGSRITGKTGYGSYPVDYRSGTDAMPSPYSSRSLDPGAGAEAVGSGGTKATGYGPESWQHEHLHHRHQYEGDPCESRAIDARGGPHFVSGPHATDTANRLDPHVSNRFGGVDTVGDSNRRHHGDKAALAGNAGAAGLGELEADHHGERTTGNTTSSGLKPSNTDGHGISSTEGMLHPRQIFQFRTILRLLSPFGFSQYLSHRLKCMLMNFLIGGAYGDNSGTTTGVSSTGKTAGPHRSDMLNKLDPRVDSDLSKQQNPHRIDHHYGRDAVLTGAGGVKLHEAEKRPRDDDPNSGISSTALGMGGHSSYRPGVDARDATRSGMARDESAVSSAGSGHQPATIPDHHYKRDAGLVSASGIGTSEAGKHLLASDHFDLAASPQDRLAGSGHQPTIDADSSSYSSSSYSRGGQSGVHTESGPPGPDVVRAGLTGEGDNVQTTRDYARIDPKTQAREHEHPRASTAIYASSGQSNDAEKGHHFGKDTETVEGTGTGAGAGAGADAFAGRERSTSHAGGYGTEPYQSTSREHHTSRDTAVLGGAVGAGGLAEHEYSDKDTAKLQKEHDKEEKALEKQHAREIKHHDKELAKEEKAHEKAIERSEKKHEKAMEKDDRKHEKAMERDETKQEHGGKKQGGLLGLFHRDKSDKELKEEEAHRKAATHPGHGKEGKLAAGADTTATESRYGYDPLQEEHGSQSGVHGTPIEIGSGPTTHDAYGAHDSGHNKLHKDPPSKVIESRGYEFK